MIIFNAFYGMDVHQKTIMIRRMTAEGEYNEPKAIPYDDEKIVKYFTKELTKYPVIQAAYEAGGCGFHLSRLLIHLGVHCIVAAPSLIAKQPGKRVKNDKIDATIILDALTEKKLVAVYVPSESDEAMRELTRQRDSVRRHLNRTKAQLLGFLRRHGVRYTEGKTNWTKLYWTWLGRLQFTDAVLHDVYLNYVETVAGLERKIKKIDDKIDHAKRKWAKKDIADALATVRGIDTLTGVGMVAEVVRFGRFSSADNFMAFIGLLPSEYSSGDRISRGPIAKTGNTRFRRLVVEATHSNRSRPNIGSARVRKRWVNQPKEICDHAWKAQRRIHKKFWRMVDRGKLPQVATIAAARELAGFIWAIGCMAEARLDRVESKPS